MKTILLILFAALMANGQTPPAKPAVPVKPATPVVRPIARPVQPIVRPLAPKPVVSPTKLNQLETTRLKMNALRIKMANDQAKVAQNAICRTHGQPVGCVISSDMTTITK